MCTELNWCTYYSKPMLMVTFHQSKHPNTFLSLKSILLFHYYEKYKSAGNNIVLISERFMAFQPLYSMPVTPYSIGTICTFKMFPNIYHIILNNYERF
jgi:hypothetical protein